MPSSLPLPLRFLPFVLPEGILPMRYDAICYGAMTILRHATTCLCDRERQSLYESIAFMFTSNASLMLFTSLFITSESVFKKH